MSRTRRKIQFEINYAKALQAMLYVLSKRETVNVYNLLKIIFEADKYHLNHHGRPVTGDVYIKMQYGTVPSFIFDMTKGEAVGLSALDRNEYPFKKTGHDLQATEMPNMDYLSRSDVEALDHGITEYIDLDFKQVEMKNHLEKCWLEAELNRPISFESIIQNDEIREMLATSPLRLVI